MEKIIQPLPSAQDIPTTLEAPPIVEQPRPEIGQPQPIVASPAPPALEPSVQTEVPSTAVDLPIGLTGSAIINEKPALPIGIYIFAILNLLAFIASFFSSTNNSAVANISMLVNLIFGVGLLFRIELVRKIAVVFATISVLIYTITFFGLLAVQHRANQAVNRFNQAISSLNTSTETIAQKQEISDLKSQIQQEKVREGHAMDLAFVVLGVEFVATSVEVFYLTRPRVMIVFQSMD